MAKGMNQKQKLLHLIKLFNERTDEEHGLSMNEIIYSLDSAGIAAERKSLYDDFEVLRVAGYDIEKRQEGNSTTYALASRTFELPELKLLVDAVQSSKFITANKSNKLISKIESLASSHQARDLQRQVFVSSRIKTMNESIYYSVDDIHRAINENVQISFQYFSWNTKKEKELRHEGKTYRVSPWGLAWEDENYYLIAYDSEAGKIKHYRVDKMLRLRVLDEPREGKEAFGDLDMGLYSKKTFAMFGGKDELVTLRCKNQLANIIIDRFGRDITVITHDSDHFDVMVRVAVSPHFLSWLMTFPDMVKIVEPQWVKDEYISLAKEALKQYE